MPKRAPLFALSIALTLCACESADAKCTRLQAAATDAWDRYAQALQKEADTAHATHDSAKKKLEGDVDKRHELEARKHADGLHGTEASTAWARTFLSAKQAQCAKDPECLELKVQVIEADKKLAELTPRIAAVRAAQSAAKSDPEVATPAAEAVSPDPDHADAEPARVASAAAIAACVEAKPAK